MEGWSVNSMSQLLLVLKLPALVDQLIVFRCFFFQCLQYSLLSKVALHPESNRTLRRLLELSLSILSDGYCLIYPKVIVDKSSIFVLFLGRKISTVETKHSE